METIFERKGNVVKVGGKTVQVPSNLSAISILSGNETYHGEEFADDSWVYRTNESGERVSGKIRKWFLNKYYSDEGLKYRIWPPNLEIKNIQKLEDTYFRLSNKLNILYKQESELVNSIVKTKILIAHAKPTHKYNGKQGLWWEYKLTIEEQYGVCWSFNWLDEKPKKLINHKLGQKLYEFDLGYKKDVIKRLSLFRRFLGEVIDKFFREKIVAKEIKSPGPSCLTINGRKYWYAIEFSKWDTLMAKKISWPEDNTIIFEV